jgi:predicted ribosome quality control (RQC) complex YloA/Tae2 family protein
VIFKGWKDIARHLGCGVRTAQRWEGEGLPVKRPTGAHRSDRGPVLAESEEIDAWVRDSALRRGDAETMAVVQRSRELRKELREARDTLGQSIKTLRKEAAEFEKAEATVGLAAVKTLLNRSDIERAELGFLHAELQVGMSLASFALDTNRGDAVERNRVNARKAHDAVVRFMPLVKLSAAESDEIKRKLADLKSKLKLLGEVV